MYANRETVLPEWRGVIGATADLRNAETILSHLGIIIDLINAK